jgi:hypothetical protein
MDNAEELISPRLPENLESLHKQEERLRTESLVAINADAELKEHLRIVEVSLDTIHAFTILHENRTKDELTIQQLGIRLFNAGTSALSLLFGWLLSEFRDVAARPVRDRIPDRLFGD